MFNNQSNNEATVAEKPMLTGWKRFAVEVVIGTAIVIMLANIFGGSKASRA